MLAIDSYKNNEILQNIEKCNKRHEKRKSKIKHVLFIYKHLKLSLL